MFIFFVSILSILIHELGHLLIAAHYRVRFKSINFVLKFGVMPAFYVKYENFYEATIKNRVSILAAGVYMNLFLASAFGIGYIFTGNWGCMLICLLNLYDVVGNLSPLSNSDGYYIFSYIFGLEGFRWKIVRKISSLLNGKEGWKSILETDNIKFVLYFLISAFIMVSSLEKLLVQTFKFLSVEIKGQWVVGMIMIGMFIKIIMSVKTLNKKMKQVT